MVGPEVRHDGTDNIYVVDKLKCDKIEIVDSIDVTTIDEPIGSGAVTISALAPSGVGTATISKWLKVINSTVTYYIPMWT